MRPYGPGHLPEPRIVDAQVHVYERDHPARPWSIEPLPDWAAAGHTGPPEVTGADMLDAMRAVGVDAAVLVSTYSVYRYDHSYAVGVADSHPSRFRVVAPVDPMRPSMRDDVDRLAAEASVVGVRLIATAELLDPVAGTPALDAFLAHAARRGLPVAVVGADLVVIARIARRHPHNRIVVDHLGMRQPLVPPPPAEPFAALPGLLKLAVLDNVVVKVTGVPTLAHTPYPFDDLWPHLERVLEAFTPDRCAWGSDWTRTHAFVDYRDGLDYIRLTDHLGPADKSRLLGDTISDVYGWDGAGRAPDPANA